MDDGGDDTTKGERRQLGFWNLLRLVVTPARLLVDRGDGCVTLVTSLAKLDATSRCAVGMPAMITLPSVISASELIAAMTTQDTFAATLQALADNDATLPGSVV